MLRRKKPHTDPNASTADILRDALGEAAREHQKKARQRRRKGRFAFLGRMPGWLQALVKLALVLLVILIIDGVRRENKELSATLVSFTGQVTVFTPGQSTATAAQPNTVLRDKDVVTTSAGSSAMITFPDGSAIQLEPGTQFVVRLLDFARGQMRDRSFMLNYGGLAARVSSFFGGNPDSQATICTPTAVAAVRGTGFRVVYDRTSKQTVLQVTDGRVLFRTGYRPVECVPGQSMSAEGYQMQAAQGLTRDVQRVLAGRVSQMSVYEKPPSTLQRVEWAAINFLDPVLQVMGVAPGCWSYSSIDFARRTAAQEGLRRLRTHIAEAAEKAPQYVNPVTLAELGLNESERERILNAFSGKMIIAYQKMPGDQYQVWARARDKKRTLYRMSESSIEKVVEQR